MSTKVISVQSQKRAAQLFNFMSIIAIMLMPIFPILLVWIAASIVVYSANIYHPNPVVRHYTKYAGYRFYGFSGSLLASMMFSSILLRAAGGAVALLMIVWTIGFLVVVPMGLHSLIRADRENWKEMLVEEGEY
jgi:hypothetical protein